MNFVDKFLGIPKPELTQEAENKNRTNIIKNWIKKTIVISKKDWFDAFMVEL